MNRTLRVGSHTETVMSDEDFKDLLRRHVGEDAAWYYEDRVKNLLGIIDTATIFTDKYDAAVKKMSTAEINSDLDNHIFYAEHTLAMAERWT